MRRCVCSRNAKNEDAMARVGPQPHRTIYIYIVRLKYKQNWINHLERMDNTRLPKDAINYKPRGRKERGRPRRLWQCVDAGTGQTT